MTMYISMLRGVNVGGHKIIMQKLRDLYTSLNFQHVKTYIQSGNVLFESFNTSCSKLEEEIEKEISNTFGLQVPIFIRTRNELETIIENNPFKDEDPNKLHVTFLSDFPDEKPVKEIEKATDSSEKFSIVQKEVYLFLPNGYGRTRLSNTFFEKKLKLSATTRNWRTVNKLLELAN